MSTNLSEQLAEAMKRARRLAAGEETAAEYHWHKGFEVHAVVSKPYRGSGTAVPLLVLVSARNGNVPTQLWITHRHFAVTAIYAEYFDPATPLPPHALVVNLIGDADICGQALKRAQEILARSSAPLINPPACVRVTGRAENARRLGLIPGVVAPAIETLSSSALLSRTDLRYPLLLRRPRASRRRTNCSPSSIWTRAARTATRANSG